MEWLLAQLVSGWWLVKVVINWSIANPGAAMFWVGVWGTLFNYLVKITPTRIDDSLLDALSRAIKEGFSKSKGLV